MFEGINFFSGLSSQEKQTLGMFCQKRNIKSGEVLFNDGEDASSMYFLVSGLLKAEKDGKILGNINPGEPVGEMALFENNSKRGAKVSAVKDSQLIVLLSFSVKDLTLKHPEILEKLKGIITFRKERNKGSI